MNSQILRNLRSEMLSFNELENSTLYNLNFKDFTARLKAEDFSQLEEDVIKTITKKLVKHTYSRKSSNNFSDFHYFVSTLDIHMLWNFYDYIIDANNFFSHCLIHQKEINQYNLLQEKISTIQKTPHKLVSEWVEEYKQRVSNTLTQTQILAQRSQKLMQDLVNLSQENSQEYIQILWDNQTADIKKYLAENSVRSKLKIRYWEISYKVRLQWELKDLSKVHIIEFLETVVKINPDILIWNIIYTKEEKFYIHIDFINKYMKFNPITHQNFPENIDVENWEYSIDTLIDIAYLHWWYTLVEKKHPLIPNKIISSVEFSDEDVENIKKIINDSKKLS